MGANGSVAASEREGTARTGVPASPAPPVTCVVVGENGLTVISSAAGGHDAGAAGGPDLAVVAAILERAASALRGEGSGSPLPHGEPTFSHRRGAPASDPLRVGQLEIHPESRLVVRDGQPVPLSRIEFDLFLALVRRAGAPATRLDLVREVWGFGAAVTSRSVDTQIYNLRHKLEENPATPRHLLTVSGIGYRVAS